MALDIIPFSNLTGGTDDSYLDYFDGDNLSDGQMAFGIVSGIQYAYVLDASSGASENSPYVIAPDTNPGTKRWILQVPGGAFSHVSANRATNQSVGASTTTLIIYNTEDHDYLSEYDHTTGVFTATYDGLYMVNARVLLDNTSWATAPRFVDLEIYKNGTQFAVGDRTVVWNTSTSYVGAGISRSIELSATDYIDIRCLHNHTSAINTFANAKFNWLTIDRIA